MSALSLLAFNRSNRKLISLLLCCHLIWGALVVGLWAVGHLLPSPGPLWAGLFAGVQMFAAAQLILPALLLHPEQRSRQFYLFWGVLLALAVWAINQPSESFAGPPVLGIVKSALLLLVGTIIAAALARYVKRLWEIVPVCIVMTAADFTSWLIGPTAGYVQQLEHYYRTAEGPPPLVEMVLVKLTLPGVKELVPVFGVSDWIMVVFFAIVARRFAVNDNLLGSPGETLARQGKLAHYLPVSVVALYLALALAQLTGMFIPALPLIALAMLVWYLLRYVLRGRRPGEEGLES